MSLINKLTFIAALVALLWGVGASADEHSPSFAPLEIYACNFRDGKDMDDLSRVITKWNAWMDSSNAPTYSAYTMTPIFYSQDITFDIAWVGAWPDGATMGASTAHWLTKGGDMRAQFEKVVDCDVHANFAVLTVKAPKDHVGAGPVEFTDCTVKEGSTLPEAMESIRQWVEYETQTGSDVANWILFPAYGEANDADYNFKWVAAHPSYESFGRAYDQFGTGGGWQKYGELFERVMTCNSPRVYDTRPVRVSPE